MAKLDEIVLIVPLGLWMLHAVCG